MTTPMQITPVKTRIFREKENITSFIEEHIAKIPNGSVLVVTSKIVALAEGRTVVRAGKKQKENLIRSESEFALKTKWCWLTIKDGMVMASAGIDESNANGKLILLPKDSYVSASKIRKAIMKKFRLKKLGVIITDSRTTPLRAGVLGMATGYAGLKGIRDYVGKPDIFGRLLKVSRTDVVNGLAAAAVLVMGEGNEKIPLALIENAPVEFAERVSRTEMSIDIKDDMYRPIFGKLPRRKK